jgi:hypothetical protein
MPHQESLSLLRLRVVADADPAALMRVLHGFQNLNVLPRRVSAEFGVNDILHIEVDVFGVPAEKLQGIQTKIREAPCVVDAYWHRI